MHGVMWSGCDIQYQDSHVWDAPVGVGDAVVEGEDERVLVEFPVNSFGVLLQYPDRRMYRCEFCNFLGWVLQPMLFGLVQ